MDFSRCVTVTGLARQISFDEQDGRAMPCDGVPRPLGRMTLVMMFKSTGVGKLDDITELWRLDGSPLRTVHVERSVDAPAMIVLKAAGQYALQMAIVYHDMVKAFSSYATDQALDERVLPGGAWGC